MILITTFYETNNKARNNEIKKCLWKNYENKYIEKIYLLNNRIYDLTYINDFKKKIVQHIISNEENYKLKYNDSIDFINNNLKNKICILSNSDIYFDNSLSKINDEIIKDNFFSLLRYDEDINETKHIFKRNDLPRDDSQDCWIFKSPLNIDLNNINFSFGTLGCDSILCSQIYNSGIKISNPSFDIISTHIHSTEFRTYNVDNRIHGKYGLIKPCKLGEYPEVIFIDY
jgi:hypothetical protein